MPCFILCQECGKIYDGWGDVHNCIAGVAGVMGAMSGFCNNCGQHGNDLVDDSTEATYSHSDLQQCVKNLQEEMTRIEGHNIENDSRFCTIEKKLSEFIEGRRAAVEATKEKILQTEGEER